MKFETDANFEPRQSVVYRQYLDLQSMAAERFSGALAGRLVLCIGFGLDGAEMALATTIAGGAILGIEPEPQLLKAAVRSGACDFMVNTLDEALRVLKNELRKRKPLSAGLLGNASEILPEMVERGVQPDLIAGATSAEAHRGALERFVDRGAEMLRGAEGYANPVAGEVVWTAANPQDLRRMDRLALDLIPAEDQVRRRWLEQAAGYFYRQLPLQRVVNLSSEEQTQFLDTLGNAASSSLFHSPAEVRWQSADGLEKTICL